MAIQINLQPFVDSIVREMNETDDERKARKVVISKFDDKLRDTVDALEARIELHEKTIAQLSAAKSVNADAIARLRVRIKRLTEKVDYYES